MKKQPSSLISTLLAAAVMASTLAIAGSAASLANNTSAETKVVIQDFESLTAGKNKLSSSSSWGGNTIYTADEAKSFSGWIGSGQCGSFWGQGAKTWFPLKDNWYDKSSGQPIAVEFKIRNNKRTNELEGLKVGFSDKIGGFTELSISSASPKKIGINKSEVIRADIPSNMELSGFKYFSASCWNVNDEALIDDITLIYSNSSSDTTATTPTTEKSTTAATTAKPTSPITEPATSTTAAPTSENPSDEFTKSPMEFVKDIKLGWNLGNTFDSYYETNVSTDKHETGWGAAKTTKAMIDLVAKSGFNAVRIPVSWNPETTYNSSTGKYTVNQSLFNRLDEILSYCTANNMYVIINMHHDDSYWLNISSDLTTSQADRSNNLTWDDIKDKYRQIWQQIAVRFNKYGEHLILEGCNEVTATATADGCGTGTGKCWWGHDYKGKTFSRMNELYNIFIDTVRSTGGNNAKRYLMIPTYGAQWYYQQMKQINVLHNYNLIIDMHWYDWSAQCNDSTLTEAANCWVWYANLKGYGLVIGECGMSRDKSLSNKINWANSFVKTLKQKYDLPVFIWDDHGNFGLLDRANTKWISGDEAYIQALDAATRK